MSALISKKGVNGNELFCLVNYQSVVFGPRRMLSYGPSLVWLKKLKSTKSYLLQTFWWWIATKDWMNIEMNNSWLFDIIIKALTKKINFLLIDKKLKNHSVWAGLFKKVLNKSGPNLSQVYNLVSRKFELIWNWKRRDG